MPRDCAYCSVKLELIEDNLTVDERLLVIEGARVWRCGRCEDRTIQRYRWIGWADAGWH
jgi:hypothetical protein